MSRQGALVPMFERATSMRMLQARELNAGRIMDGAFHRIALAVMLGLAIQAGHADSQAIDVQNSRLTVFVYKAGLFSAFADNHRITAPITSGAISEESPLAVAIVVKAGDLDVADENLDQGARAEVRRRMLGSDVLDTAAFPTISFASTRIEASGADRWNVSGHLKIHGVDRLVTFPTARMGGRYRGQFAINQSDFGIKPIRIAGGTVRVKDEVTIEFEISPARTLPSR